MAGNGRLPSYNGKVRLVVTVPRLTKSLIPSSLSPVLSTHSVTCSLTVLVSILGALAAEIAEAAAVVVAAADVREVFDMQSTGGTACSSGGQ